MKSGISIIMLGIIGFAAAQADAYESRFGFTIDLSSRWHIVNEESLKKDPTLAGRLRRFEKDLLDHNIQAVRVGQAEIYYDDFHDTLYVQPDRGGMRPYKALEPHICNKDLLQKTFSRTFGRPVRVHACLVLRVSTYDAVYMDYDGAQLGTRSLQYQIWKTSNETVILTLTARNKNLQKLRDEFAAMIYSFKASN